MESARPNTVPTPQRAPGALHTSTVPSGSSVFRPHSQEVNNRVSPAQPHTQPGHQQAQLLLGLVKDPGGSKAGV